MKNIKKTLSLLLVLCMVFGNIGTAFAASGDEVIETETATEAVSVETEASSEALTEKTPETTEEENTTEAEATASTELTREEIPAEASISDTPVMNAMDAAGTADKPSLLADSALEIRAFHLDCGRKYFSVAQIKTIIDEMYQDGYNALELAIGNDGMRFLLDDMSITVNGTTYSSDAVKNAIHAGNIAYSDQGASNELTQSEMNEIIAYANARGIQIIPLINSPGHCDAILAAATSLTGTNCSYNNSARTINITNSTATAFTKAVIQKYVSYFASKGSTYFNIGADEFANDVYTSGGMGFGNLTSTGKYSYFVTYVNELCAIVKNAGMTPIAFNDGIYYNETTSAGTFDSDLVISYWSSGWGGYNVASASYLAGKGHRILNTNGDWYYVNNQSSSSNSITNINKTPYNYVMGTGTMDVMGSMICYWCDVPGNNYGTTEENNVKSQISAFATKNSSVFDTSEKPEITDPSESSSEEPSSEEPSTEEPSVEPSTEETQETEAPVAANVVVELVVDESKTVDTITSGNYQGQEDRTYFDSNIATATVVGTTQSGSVTTNSVTSISSGQTYLIVNNKSNNTLTNEVSGNYLLQNGTVSSADGVGGEVWTINATDGGYYVQDTNGKYLTIGNGTAVLSDTPNVVNIEYLNGTYKWQLYENADVYNKKSVSYSTSNEYSTYTNGNYYYKVSDNDYRGIYSISCTRTGRSVFSYKYSWTVKYQGDTYSTNASSDSSIDIYKKEQGSVYLNDYGGTGTNAAGYTSGASSDTGSRWNLYTITKTNDANYTDVTFTGVTPGTTYLTVGEKTYKVIVRKKTQNVTVEQGATVSYTDRTAATAVVANPAIASTSVSNGNLVIKGESVGTTTINTTNCTYYVTVTEENIGNARSQTVEYWITNGVVTADGATSKTLTATQCYGANGKALNTIVPVTGTGNGETVVLWKGTLLDSEHKQTTEGGVDRTKDGYDFAYIRYYNKQWSVSADGSNWTNVTSEDQLAIYYLIKKEITDEVTSYFVDFGPQKTNWGDLGYLGTKYVILDLSVKYESGDETPSTFPNATSIAYHCDTTTENNGKKYRSLGLIKAEESDDYEVYMITVTPSSDDATALADNVKSNTSITYGGTEKVAWAATEQDLTNSGLGTFSSITGAFGYSVGGEPIVSGLEIYTTTAMKVTFYVRAKKNEDSLTVQYINNTTGDVFYNYNIIVSEGTLFDQAIALTNGTVVNGTVQNSLGNNQTVSADLSSMPAIGATYRYSEYECVNLVKSADGKTVNLYYTFNNEHRFMIDTSMPVKISTADLGITGDWISATISGAKYGEAVVSVGNGITYTPSKTIDGIETLTLTLTAANGETSSQIIVLHPATTLYYEEGFANLGKFANNGASKNTLTDAQKNGDSDNYGYEAAYADDGIGASNGTYASSSAKADSMTFSFIGTGIDVYFNSTSSSGDAIVSVKKGTSLVKYVIVETKSKSDLYENLDDSEEYNLPMLSLQNLEYGNYSVTIKAVSGAPVSVDGFRVYGPIENADSVYVKDREDAPVYLELRDHVINAMNIDVDGYEEAGSDYFEQVYAQDLSDIAMSAIVYKQASGDKNLYERENLIENGPKNELFLLPGEAVTFTVVTERDIQVGLKAVNDAVTYTINNGSAETLNTSVDMFYSVEKNVTEYIEDGVTEKRQNVTICNTSSSAVLSITKIKVCDDPNPEFAPITFDDFMNACKAIGLVKEEPEVTYADANLAINLVDYTGKAVAAASLTTNGIDGEVCEFGSEEILEAINAVLPAGYAIANKTSVTASEVAYGENGSLNVLVGKAATLKITYKKGSKTVGSTVLIHVQTSSASSTTFTTTEIKSAAPSGYTAISLAGTSVKYGQTKSISASCR